MYVNAVCECCAKMSQKVEDYTCIDRNKDRDDHFAVKRNDLLSVSLTSHTY